jgi:hypothetical protein
MFSDSKMHFLVVGELVVGEGAGFVGDDGLAGGGMGDDEAASSTMAVETDGCAAGRGT